MPRGAGRQDAAVDEVGDRPRRPRHCRTRRCGRAARRRSPPLAACRRAGRGRSGPSPRPRRSRRGGGPRRTPPSGCPPLRPGRRSGSGPARRRPRRRVRTSSAPAPGGRPPPARPRWRCPTGAAAAPHWRRSRSTRSSDSGPSPSPATAAYAASTLLPVVESLSAMGVVDAVPQRLGVAGFEDEARHVADAAVGVLDLPPRPGEGGLDLLAEAEGLLVRAVSAGASIGVIGVCMRDIAGRVISSRMVEMARDAASACRWSNAAMVAEAPLPEWRSCASRASCAGSAVACPAVRGMPVSSATTARSACRTLPPKASEGAAAAEPARHPLLEARLARQQAGPQHPHLLLGRQVGDIDPGFPEHRDGLRGHPVAVWDEEDFGVAGEPRSAAEEAQQLGGARGDQRRGARGGAAQHARDRGLLRVDALLAAEQNRRSIGARRRPGVEAAADQDAGGQHLIMPIGTPTATSRAACMASLPLNPGLLR